MLTSRSPGIAAFPSSQQGFQQGHIAYIGLDHHHRAPYLESIAQLDATVTSACEPAASTTPSNVPNLADDTAFYTDPVDLLDGENVDLLRLTLSNAVTPPIASAALERDIDVFTEKPIARTESDLDPLLATERASEAGIAISYLCEGRYDTKIDVYGADGCSSWDPIGPTFGFDGETILDLDRASGDWESTPQRTITYEYDSTPSYGGRWGLRLIKQSLDVLDSGSEGPVTLDDALTILRVLEAVYESAETCEWIPVDA